MTRGGRAEATVTGNGRELHKEWCNPIFISDSLENDLFFRATIKPAYQRRFSIHLSLALVHIVVSLRKGVVKPKAKISSKHGPFPLAYAGDKGLLLPSQLRSQSLSIFPML
jgi:hypothetical protein